MINLLHNHCESVMKEFCLFLWLTGKLNLLSSQTQQWLCNKLCAWRHNMPPPRPAVRTLRPTSSPQPTRLTPAAPGAPCVMNIHDRQAAARSGYDYGVVHINYVVTWTANQSGLVTLTFDLMTLKVVSESRVTWATSVPIVVFLGLSVLQLGPMYATDRIRQTSDKSIA